MSWMLFYEMKRIPTGRDARCTVQEGCLSPVCLPRNTNVVLRCRSGSSISASAGSRHLSAIKTIFNMKCRFMDMDETKIYRGSGNVFADLKILNADTHLLKAELVNRIGEIIRLRNLTLIVNNTRFLVLP